MKDITKTPRGAGRSAFTLAEVLITIAIIGIVAALTIPTVIAKFQQRELYTRFITTYNILNSVFVQMKAEGLIDTDDQGRDIPTYALEKLKYTRKDIDKYYCYDNLQGGYKCARGMGSPFGESYLYTLPNGADFSIGYVQSSFNYLGFHVDTNGVDKGPNIEGRDYFDLNFFPYQMSVSSAIYSYPNWYNDLRNKSKFTDFYTGFCYTSGNVRKDEVTGGLNCPIRLLREGKMDY